MRISSIPTADSTPYTTLITTPERYACITGPTYHLRGNRSSDDTLDPPGEHLEIVINCK